MSFEGGPTAVPPQTTASRAPARNVPPTAPLASAVRAAQAKAVAVATAVPAATVLADAPVKPVAPAAAAPSQPESTPRIEPTLAPPLAPMAAAPVKKAVSVVPVDWEEQLSKPPAPKPEPPLVVAAPVAVPAVAKPMRSLEEVRADLARLRASAKERHTLAPVKRDTHFEPTDFQDFVVPEPRPEPDSYAPTAYMGFTNLKPLPATPQRDD
ncbi:hypothetical protein WKW79_16040 [Variovorax robiniae]|uniref:Uncharacterized protein n=1 Tax=Variovorax robiniae TaxID=1836199 RepID=A0ABU8X8B7_9BURK